MTRFGNAPVDVTVRRWRRYGFDRLHGDSRDGRCVGWIDLDTGEQRIELAGRVAGGICTPRLSQNRT